MVDESLWHAEGVQEHLQGALEALRSSKAAQVFEKLVFENLVFKNRVFEEEVQS